MPILLQWSWARIEVEAWPFTPQARLAEGKTWTILICPGLVWLITGFVQLLYSLNRALRLDPRTEAQARAPLEICFGLHHVHAQARSAVSALRLLVDVRGKLSDQDDERLLSILQRHSK